MDNKHCASSLRLRHALQIEAGPDWEVLGDKGVVETLSLNLGMRTRYSSIGTLYSTFP